MNVKAENIQAFEKKECCLIIAEAGVNHNGDLKTALKLCDAAKNSGADVVKFQTWITEKLITKSVQQAEYQKKNTGLVESQYKMLKRLELSFEGFRKIKAYCDNIGIVFASTAADEESLDFLIDLGIPFVKIGSGDIGNIPFLRKIGSKKFPVIMSTGMSSLSDVDVSTKTLLDAGTENITLLHCTTNYPCPYGEVNLRAMLTLRERYGFPIGYSDHTIGSEIAISAVALGAKVIEKHFTLDRSMEGPDHIASTEPDEFCQLVRQIRNLEMAMGDGKKDLSISEKRIKDVVTKRIVAARKILRGEVFSIANICVKRSNEGALSVFWDDMIGRRAAKDYQPDDGVEL